MGKSLEMLRGTGWEELRDIVLFGYGRQGKKAIETLCRDFNIVAVVENDPEKEGQDIAGIPVVLFSENLKFLKKNKIIITTSERYYKEIKCQLEKIGLEEYRDFVMYQQFIVEWYFRFKKKLYIPKTDLPITPYCTLNCEKCHIFIPYWKNKKEYDLENIKTTLDGFFQYVDYVLDMDILGGEPFIYRELDRVIAYIGENYREKIGYLGLITNGTVIPSEDTLSLLRKYNIRVSISDYSKEISYEDKINRLCGLLEAKEIQYIRNSDITWFDFGFPKQKYSYRGKAAKDHMECCNTIYHVIHEGRFYCCGTAWAAEKSGLFPASTYGYVDLEKESGTEEQKRKILDCSLGNVKEGYLEFCQVCGGFGNDNSHIVPTARQWKRNENGGSLEWKTKK